VVAERAPRARAGRPLSSLSDAYQPVDFSALPVGPDFELVDGELLARLAARAFQFAIRIDSIRFVMRIDSNRFVL